MAFNIIKSGTWGECLWGIDDTGFMVIDEGRAASINNDNEIPWYEEASSITEVKIRGKITLPKDASLQGMFKDCVNLAVANLEGLDTSTVTNMSSMFENCLSLKELDLKSFNTSNVVDMSRMFYACKVMTNLDLSSFATYGVSDMRNMFGKCKILYSIVLGDGFSAKGNGLTDCGNLTIRNTGKYRMAKVVSALGGAIIYHENRADNDIHEIQSITGYRYLVEDIKFQSPGQKYIFMGWNTQADGSGKTFLPGQEIANLDDDLDLYAIWSCPPSIGKVEPLEEIPYGQPLPFNLPDVYVENDKPVVGYLEISPNGKDGTWREMERTTILPVKCNGYQVRLVAENECGKAYSNAVTVKIRKAGINLSRIRWVEESNMTYDGTQKKVWLEGLPKDVNAIYTNNTGIKAGERVATVILEYDEENFDIPVKIKPHNWTIKKARYDMSGVSWDYSKPFTYDGIEKMVTLMGIPEGVEAKYEGCVGTNAGIYTASVSFDYDIDNYEKIDEIVPCVWEIRKAYLDVRKLKWSSYSDFVYTGEPKSVRVENLPDDAKVEYLGNEEVLAGRYLARANLIGNYYTSEPIEYEWQIEKAKYNMATITWNYTQPFIYDNTIHEVKLEKIPAGLSVKYFNNVGIDTGNYVARVSFACDDSHNYETPDDLTFTWSIQKAVLDMSQVRWNYTEPFEYDGGVKSIELVGLPEGVYAVIDNGSAIQAGIYQAHANMQYDNRNIYVEQPADCQWQIKKASYDMTPVCWNYEKPFVYDGEEKVLFLLNVPEGLNVEYSNNVKLEAGKYVASARLTPSDVVNYEVPEINACTWAINKATIDEGNITWTDDRAFVYDGTAKNVEIISEISDKISVEYNGDRAVDAGQHEATATFYPVDSDNYEAPEPIHHMWTIEKGEFDLSNMSWDYSAEFTYDGTTKTVVLTDIPEGVVVTYENNEAVETGKYVAIAHLKILNDQNYNELQPFELRWSINKANYDMSKASWQDERRFKYDGSDKEVVVTGLPEGVYPVYENNIAKYTGEYNAEVDFEYDENNYEKPVLAPCRWIIEKSEFDTENAKWDYEKPFIYDGKEKSVEVIDMPEGATVKYDNATAVDAGIYFATAEVIADDDVNYTSTTMPDLAWTIEKGEYDMSDVYWDYDRPFKYDGEEKTVVLKGLPEGVIPTYYGNKESETGDYIASVTFSVLDPNNYEVPEFKNCEWKIEKQDIDMSGVEWNYYKPFTFDNRIHEITLNNLPKGIKVNYLGNCETDAGMYKASAEFIVFDAQNYNTPTFEDCNWEITKADYDMSEVRWDYDDSKIFNGREQSIYLENLPNGVRVEYSGNTEITVGKYRAIAELTTIDPNNYNNPSVSSCNWEIVKADINMSEVKWDYEPGKFTYDGKEKSVQLTNVPEFVNVIYKGETAENAGNYVAIAEFIVNNPNYIKPDALTLEWTINKAECDMSEVKWNYTNEFTYNGQPQGIEIAGVPKTLIAHCENNRNINAGHYVAVVSFEAVSDNYRVPEDITCEWTINKTMCDISSITWDYSQNFKYDGAPKEVLLAGVPDLLRVEYTGNVATKAGKYVAHADFVPVDEINYKAPQPMECDWEITKTEYDMSETRWSIDRKFVYDGTEKSVFLEGYPDGITPIYTQNSESNCGEYTATVKFAYDEDNYNEPKIRNCKWKITKAKYDFSNVYWDYSDAFSYDGELKVVELVGLPEGIEAIYTENSKYDVGKYTAEVQLRYDENNYKEPSMKECKWEIKKANPPIDTNKLEWTFSTPFEYDGTPKTVKIASYKGSQNFFDKLRGKAPEMHLAGIPDGFEVVEYYGNEEAEVGIYYAKALIRHASNQNYNDFMTPEIRWEIKKAEINMSKVRWDYSVPYTYDGREKKVELLNVPEMVRVDYSNNTATKAGSYEAKATFTVLDPERFEIPKQFKGCWWTIEKAQYDMSEAKWEYSDNFIYDGKEKIVEVVGLPDGVEIEHYEGNKEFEAGSYVADVKLKHYDKENHMMPVLPALRWRIKKKEINTDSIIWNYSSNNELYYDGEPKEVKLIGVPKNIKVSYINNAKTNAGTYIAKARLLYDTKNYDINDVPDLVWTINKATIDISKMSWNYEGPFTYDGERKSIWLENVPDEVTVRYIDNKASMVGSYTAKAYLSYNTDNYEEIAVETSIEWEIVK